VVTGKRLLAEIQQNMHSYKIEKIIQGDGSAKRKMKNKNTQQLSTFCHN
jgi:stalled ribosome alternative rescue factor ArfA